MNEIPIEKLLPQGLQDMLSAQREFMAQANDIHNEIIDREMKTLHLPLKAKWYEMIESGVKTEEYREIKPYWENRIRCQAYYRGYEKRQETDDGRKLFP